MNRIAFLSIIVLTALVFTCTPLITPLQPRTNPNDPENVVPVAESFTATMNWDNPDAPLVSLDWIPANPSNVDYHRDGYVIVRKTGTFPANVFDGYGVVGGDPLGPDDSNYMDPRDNNDDDVIEGAFSGYTNYYGLFAFWRTEDADGNLYYDTTNQRLENTKGYVFSGPVTASVLVPRTVVLDVLEDYGVDNANTWWDSGQIRLVYTSDGASGVITQLGIVKFNTDSLQGVTVTWAGFVLRNLLDNPAQPIRVSLIDLGWNVNDPFTDLTNASFVDPSLQTDFTLGDTAENGTSTLSDSSLVEMVSAWSSGRANNGIRLDPYSDDGTTSYTYYFYSSNSDYPPQLRVSYHLE